MNWLKVLSRYRKTLTTLVGGTAAWGIGLPDGSISRASWFGLLAVWATGGVVYAIPNSPPEGEAADPNMSEQGQGE